MHHLAQFDCQIDTYLGHFTPILRLVRHFGAHVLDQDPHRGKNVLPLTLDQVTANNDYLQ